MLFVRTNTTDPVENLAVEEYYLHRSDEDVFMLWQNRPTVVIGRNQNIYAEVDLELCEKLGITVVRRITGGGAVYHDLGNVNYTFITSREKAKALDFSYFTSPIIAALGELGAEAVLSGRNDLMAGDAKFSGNAQHADEKRILHHGTLLFSSDLSVLSGVLKPDPEKLSRKGIKSVRSRVVNLSELISEELTVSEFMERITSSVVARFSAEVIDADLEEVRKTKSFERLSGRDWLYGRRENHTFEKKARFDGGTVAVLFDLDGGCIRNPRIEGDFFGEKNIEGLEALLEGCPYDAKELAALLDAAGVGDYISGCGARELRELILSESDAKTKN